MDLHPFVDELRHQLMVAAEAGGDDARAVAERLSVALEPAARLVLLDALSVAADAITLDLAPGSVEVRLRGREPEFVVTPPEPDAPEGPAVAVAAGSVRAPEPARSGGESDESGTSRLTLRMPESLKVRIEDAAGRDGVSVNAWLTRTIAEAMGPGHPISSSAQQPPTGGQRLTGWAR